MLGHQVPHLPPSMTIGVTSSSGWLEPHGRSSGGVSTRNGLRLGAWWPGSIAHGADSVRGGESPAHRN